MMGPGHILPANQTEWITNATSCGRIPSDYKLPIICSLTWSNFTATSPTNSSQLDEIAASGALFDKYQQCCEPWSVLTWNVWTNTRSCGLYCYTDDYGKQEGFDRCIRETKAKAVKERNATWTDEAGFCETINYKALKKGVPSGGERVSRSSWGVLGMVMVAGLVGSMA